MLFLYFFYYYFVLFLSLPIMCYVLLDKEVMKI